MYWRHDEGDFLDVLGGGSEETLAFDAYETSEPCISVSVELLGVSEGALDGFLSSFVDGLTMGG